MRAEIRALAMDVDGVLTDGGFWWGGNGEEFKRFCFADIMGLSLARNAGLQLALISGEDSTLIDRFAAKARIDHVYKGCRDKRSALKDFSRLTGIDLKQICFVGDDINDLDALNCAGLGAAPANAQPMVRSAVTWRLTQSGGNGAIREIVDALLAARSRA